jgi:ribosomal protein S18 acetylase RimI-like enzyme
MTGTLLADFDVTRLDELIVMWRASFEAGVGVVDPHPIADQRRYFVDEVLPRNAVRVAFVSGELAGFVAASRESVAQLYVRVGLQQQGVGTRLLDWAKSNSGGSLWLYTFARNGVARAFYEKNGFAAVAHGFEPFWQLEDVKYEWAPGKRTC